MDGAAHPTLLESIAAWALTVACVYSIAYEFWRSTAKAGTSRHDTMRGFVAQLWQYALGAVVIVLLFLGVPFAAWIGLGFSAIVIVVSIFFYNPTIMLERQPTIADWIEDLVFTGLQFVVVTLLVFEVSGLLLS
ncbi:hypothetical protein [Agromyces seonyuensis]|uniref:DUF1761 family protein n=1 Tax=Agromyces seonyuensis TaxID=2662446 RepID=A0A6I4NUP8_9MICO|nr:hypothetical protein [Agromyces seonyuensis]MWB97811.1 hypothetical protein [Agromyces seonyuensis]